MKKFLCFSLVLMLITCLLPITAFAAGSNIDAPGSGSVPVTLTSAAATFSVTVPTALPVNVDANGVVTTATAAYIVNNSYGPVKVSGVAISGKNGWSIVSFDSTDMTAIPANTQSMAMNINGSKTTGADAIDFASGVYPVMAGAGTTIADANKMLINYSAKMPARTLGLTDAEVAQVVFTVAWN